MFEHDARMGLFHPISATSWLALWMRNPLRMQPFRALQPGTLNVEPLNQSNCQIDKAVVFFYTFADLNSNPIFYLYYSRGDKYAGFKPFKLPYPSGTWSDPFQIWRPMRNSAGSVGDCIRSVLKYPWNRHLELPAPARRWVCKLPVYGRSCQWRSTRNFARTHIRKNKASNRLPGFDQW